MKTKKILVIVLLIGVYSPNMFSQVLDNDSVYTILNKPDSITNIPYKKLLNREFTKVLTGQNTNFGTYATLGTKDEIVTLAGNIPLKGKSSIGINFSGGVTEGIVPLLNGEDVSSNIKVGLQLNFGIYKHERSLKADATQILNFEYMEDSLFIATMKNRDKVDKDSTLLELSIRKKELELKQKTRNLQVLKNKKTNISTKTTDIITIDSINVLILSMENDIAVLRKDTSYLNRHVSNLTPTMRARQKNNIETNKIKKYKKELLKLRLKQYNLKWFALESSINNRSFNQFDISQSYEDQIKQKTFNRFELGISYNRYRLKDQSLV